MKVLLINLVREIYWKDRENIEFQILLEKIKSLAEVELFSMSENSINNIINLRHETFIEKDIYIFMIDFNADAVIIDTIYTLSTFIKAHNENAKIVLIGERAALHAKQIIEDCNEIDYIFVGEVEDIATKIVDVCDHPSLSVIQKKSEISNELIRPKRDVKLIKEVKSAKVRTTRGCYGDCLFCIDKGSIGITKIRMMKEVVEEIENIIKKCNIKKISFCDNSFEDPDYIEKTRIKEFLKLIKERNLKLYFECSIRAESFKTPNDFELLKEMSKCGFYRIIVGYESGCAEDLRFFKKRATVEDNLRTAKFLRECKINTILPPGFIMFHPLSTVESLQQNYSFLKSINKGYNMLAVCSFLKVFPGSRMHMVLKEKQLVEERCSYKDLVPYFYENQEIAQLANLLYKERYTSKAVEMAMRIEDMRDLLAQAQKKYVNWKGIEEFEKTIETISKEVSGYVEDFFESCLNNMCNFEFINRKYKELEHKVQNIRCYEGLRKFVLSNLSNCELDYLI